MFGHSRWSLGLAAGVALFTALAAPVSAQETVLNLYSSRHYQTDEALYAGFTKRTGIRINTIAPTFIRTPRSAATLDIPERAAWIAEKIKLDRVGEVEDIMGAVGYRASDSAAMVTGTSLLIDGGWTAD